MGTFYDEWLAAGERIQQEFRRSPMIAHDRNIPWVRTRQDAKVLMVANDACAARDVYMNMNITTIAPAPANSCASSLESVTGLRTFGQKDTSPSVLR
jgi:hypothetical protein